MSVWPKFESFGQSQRASSKKPCCVWLDQRLMSGLDILNVSPQIFKSADFHGIWFYSVISVIMEFLINLYTACNSFYLVSAYIMKSLFRRLFMLGRLTATGQRNLYISYRSMYTVFDFYTFFLCCTYVAMIKVTYRISSALMQQTDFFSFATSSDLILILIFL